MSPRTTAQGNATRHGWLLYPALVALLTGWGGFWFVVIVSSTSPARGPAFWCSVLSGAGLLLTLVGLMVGCAEADGGATLPWSRLDWTVDRVLRVDRPQPQATRPRRPHCRFR